MLPTGDLREGRGGAGRAQLVVVTKCPMDLSPSEKETIRKKLSLNGDQQLFFSGISYGSRVMSAASQLELRDLGKFQLVTGIANPKPLTDHLASQNLEFDHLSFPDHHNFKETEIEALRKHSFVLTTEKDYMRLKGHLAPENLYYLPMEMTFLSREEQQRFDLLVKQYCRRS